MNWLCRIFGHRWRSEFIGGHVHAGDDWGGDRLSDGTPFVSAWHKTCRRCGRWA